MNRNYYHQLYDTYHNVLSAKQKDYFELYYFEDLSLSEIAENMQVTRSAVSKNINQSVKILNDYEEKLGFLQKKEAIKKLLLDNNIDESIVNEVMEKM